MFTGLIETVGTVKRTDKKQDNLILTVRSSISAALKIDQSVSHNGVCLTVIHTEEDTHQIEAVEETLSKSNLGRLKIGDAINLERALTLEKRLDGHLVQGHVDAVGNCMRCEEKEGSTIFTFQFPEKFAAFIIEKGSIAVNGVSLTAFNVTQDQFSVAIIPYTLTHTMLQYLDPGGEVNLEFDLVGKYVLRSKELTSVSG